MMCCAYHLLISQKGAFDFILCKESKESCVHLYVCILYLDGSFSAFPSSKLSDGSAKPSGSTGNTHFLIFLRIFWLLSPFSKTHVSMACHACQWRIAKKKIPTELQFFDAQGQGGEVVHHHQPTTHRGGVSLRCLGLGWGGGEGLRSRKCCWAFLIDHLGHLIILSAREKRGLAGYVSAEPGYAGLIDEARHYMIYGKATKEEQQAMVVRVLSTLAGPAVPPTWKLFFFCQRS